MLWFRNLHPMLRVGIIVVAATLPFAIYALLRAERPVPVEEPAFEPIPTGSPDTPLAFPFGTEPTTTSSTLPVESTTEVTTARAAARPQCSDGRDNDRDGRIDLRDPGCRSSSDNSEFSTTATTRRAVTTRPPAIRTTTPTTRPSGTGSSGAGSPGGSTNSPTSN
jgi:hypothetical protein